MREGFVMLELREEMGGCLGFGEAGRFACS